LDIQTFALTSIGCRTNQYEIQALKKQLEAFGCAQVDSDADLCIVNTCSVTEAAESSSRRAIRSIIRRHPKARVIVTGCLAARSPEMIQSIDGVTDLIAEKENIVQQLFPGQTVVPFSISTFSDHTRAFVKVQDGCNNFCSYCIIPYVRGRSRSRNTDSILKEIHELIHSGHQEIVLTGIDVGDFSDNGLVLSDLVSMVDAIEGVKRLRISSINPNQVDEKMVDVILSGKNTCHSMHLVLQSGSTDILRKMRRLYTREQFLETVELFRSKAKDFMFTTDIIVGFPGENDDDFEQTLDLVEQVQFAKVHMFPYSERPKTQAERLLGKVPSGIITKRKNHLLQLAEKTAHDLRECYVGSYAEVLTEDSDGKWLSGQTRNGLPVLIEKNSAQPNQLLTVYLEKNTDCALIGSLG